MADAMVSILVVVLVIGGGIWIWDLVAGDLPLVYANIYIH
jgi:hypothetical protein